MKAYTKRCLVALLSVLFIHGCATAPEKGIEDQPAEETKIYASFNAETIAQQQFALTDFKPNPNLENNPRVDRDTMKLFDRAVDAMNEKKWDEAKAILEPLYEEQVHLSGPAYNLAVLYVQQDLIDEAMKYLNVALLRNHYNFDARNLLGYLYREQGNFLDAEKYWLENLTVWGGYAPSYKNLGILYDLYQGKPEKALGYYKQFNRLQASPDKMVKGWIISIDRLIALKQKQQKEIKQAQASPETLVDGDEERRVQ